MKHFTITLLLLSLAFSTAAIAQTRSQTAYYTDGLLRLGYELGDDPMATNGFRLRWNATT